MEAKIAARLIPKLIDHGVEYHCRKRLRLWCDCRYCLAKKRGSAAIGWVGQDVTWPHSHTLVYDYDAWEIGARIKAARNKKIKALRLQLKTIKEEPLDVAVTEQ